MRNSCRLLASLVVSLVISFGFGLANSAYGTVFDAVDGFTTAANTETSLWSYRFANDELRDGSYSLITATGTLPSWPGAEFWFTPPASFAVPLLGANRTGGTLTSGAVVWPDDTLYAHPGNGGLVLLSWLSPSTLVTDIAFAVTDADPGGGDGIAWFLELNNAGDTLASGVIDNGGGTAPLLVSDVSVQSGDRINLVIGDRGGFSFDSTLLTMTITVVPEPSTLSLMIIGGVLVRCARRRRRQSGHA
jgi:hypothetical protein